jgi:hypothetical protein
MARGILTRQQILGTFCQESGCQVLKRPARYRPTSSRVILGNDEPTSAEARIHDDGSGRFSADLLDRQTARR